MSRKDRKKVPTAKLRREQRAAAALRLPISRRQAGVALVAVALIYAFLVGFHSVYDPDMGWHMATGRYIWQHRAIPATDVLSYTSPGVEWIYPPFAGVLFYAIHSVAGYAGLTWFCASALTVLVAVLLHGSSERPPIMTALLAMLATPVLVTRMSPRPDLFTHLLFAIVLVQLWRFHRSGAERDGPQPVRARLWSLPLLMVLWVNLHPGFLAGLGLIFAYVLMECLEFLFPPRRAAALERLRGAWPFLAATVIATLLNPFGYKVFQAALGLAGIVPNGQAAIAKSSFEAQPIPISMFFPDTVLTQAMNWSDPGSSFWWLVIVAAVVIVLSLWQRRFDAALLTAGAWYATLQSQRFMGLFSILVVVVGGGVFAETLGRRDGSGIETGPSNSRALPATMAALALVITLITCRRAIDLVSNRTYAVNSASTSFGAGESWWFPEDAADFTLREQLPGNVLGTFNLGGFSAWRLGPRYGDFIDGRGVSAAVGSEYNTVISAPVDSLTWQEEAAHRNINTLFFPLARDINLGTPNLPSLCRGTLFRPVFLDTVSIVLVRDTPENRPWLDRLQIDCGTQQFKPPADRSRLELAAFYANSGAIELSLGRVAEAQEALRRGAELAPEDPSIRRTLARAFHSQP